MYYKRPALICIPTNVREAILRTKTLMRLYKLAKEEYDIAKEFPKQYSIASRVYHEVIAKLPDFHPSSIVDLNAGAGASTAAALEHFPFITSATVVETKEAMLSIASTILKELNIDFIGTRYLSPLLEPSDLVVSSFLMSSIKDKGLANQMIESLWEKTKKILVLIEDPLNFSFILDQRKKLVTENSWILAPCAHSLDCPKAETGCSFKHEYQTPKFQMQALNYKVDSHPFFYSYIVLSKDCVKATSRIVESPKKVDRLVRMSLCRSDGQIKEVCVPKSYGKDIFKAARQAAVGDDWIFKTTK